MEAQGTNKLPQEGTTNRGESLTDSKSVCPAYSGGGNPCSGSDSRLDLSGLAEAIRQAPQTSSMSTKWQVVARQPYHKKKPTHPERSRPLGRARKERRHRNHDNKVSRVEKTTAPAPALSESVPTTSSTPTGEPQVKTPKRNENPTTEKPTEELPKTRRRPRGYRGRRIAAKASQAPKMDQPVTSDRPSERAPSKRERLDETQTPRGDAKRAKTDARARRTASYADATQAHLQVAVITVPPKDLSQEEAEQLKRAIDDRILEAVLNPPSPSATAPSFRGRPFLHEGVLAMWCENDNAASWLENNIAKIESPIANTTLKVVKQSELKKRVRAGLLLFTRIKDAATLQKVLCAQNPWYKVDQWILYKLTTDVNIPGAQEKAVHLVLGIPEEEKPAILDRDRRVAHMSGSGYIRFFLGEDEAAADDEAAAMCVTADAATTEPAPASSAPVHPSSELELESTSSNEGATSDEDDVLRSA